MVVSLDYFVEIQSRVQRAAAKGMWPHQAGGEHLLLSSVIHGAGAAGGVAGAGGILEETMAIVQGPVISTPRQGARKPNKGPAAF